MSKDLVRPPSMRSFGSGLGAVNDAPLMAPLPSSVYELRPMGASGYSGNRLHRLKGSLTLVAQSFRANLEQIYSVGAAGVSARKCHSAEQNKRIY